MKNVINSSDLVLQYENGLATLSLFMNMFYRVSE